ncbi:hypothetical protein HZA75_07015 [Candidatus Roizmanbacteria bacterium]|nr:hypothetical protein [Candidatus Roizmanbacteria bacterium]
MKMTLTKKDKILAGITILLYVLGLFIGGWGIFPNLLFLFFAYSVFRKSYDKGKFSTFHLIILMVIIALSLLIKIGLFLDYFQDYFIKKSFEEKILKQEPKTEFETNNSTLPISYLVPELNLSFELLPKLSKCGTFTISFEGGTYSKRTLASKFSDFTCNYNLYLNSYSVNDKSAMGNLNIFMNIQGYVKKNNDFFYIRYYGDQIKETLIPKEAEPIEIQSDYGIKMLRVKGTGSMTETQPQWWVGGLTMADKGVIINTGNDTYPALVVATDLKKTGLTEEEFLKILMSFKKN